MIKRVQRGRNHTYVIDDIKTIGVTTALSKGMPKPALPYWAAKTVAQTVADMDAADLDRLRHLGRESMIGALKAAPWQQRDDAAKRGTEVHTIAEALVLGKQVQVPQELAGHVDSAVKFMDQWQVRPVLIERTVGSYRYGYAGTFDLIADLPDGRRVLFDYKTSQSGIWPETALQLAAYRYADAYVADDVDKTEVLMSEVGIDECKAVWVRADGYDVIPLDTSREVFRSFLHVLAVARTADVMAAWVQPAEYPAVQPS